jgi:hypothetical protein
MFAKRNINLWIPSEPRSRRMAFGGNHLCIL